MEDYFVIQDDRLIECVNKEILSAVIPEGVTEIAENAFYGCNNLSAVSFPQSLKKIRDSAFKNCISLTQIDLSYIEILGAYVFNGCISLESVKFGSDIGYLCNGTFENCILLKEIMLPENIVYVGCECFKDCISLKSVEMGNVMEIDTSAFENCSMLYSLTLPETLLHISPYAFSFCCSLKSVTVRNRIIDIDEAAFENTVDIVIKASKCSAAYKYAVETGYKCMPTIIDECCLIIDGSYVSRLNKAGIFFQMKPLDEVGKVIIRFDTSQKKEIEKIIGGKQNDK